MNYLNPIQRIIIALLCLCFSLQSRAQTLVSAPMTGTPAAGEYYGTSGITLAPNFSFIASSGQNLRLYINNSVPVLVPVTPSTNQNYIRVLTPRTAIKTEAELTTHSSNKDLVQTEIQYFDGLGRPLQTIQVKGNPDGTKDIVQPVEYDHYGREVKKYLPFAYTGTPDGTFKSDAIAKQASFYNLTGNGVSGTQQGNGIPVIPTPYAQTVIESSPLSRVLQQGAPGDAWQPGTRTATAGRTVMTDYTFNNQTGFTTTPVTGNAGSRKVVLYTVSSTGALTRSPGTAYYASNQLYVTIIKDENWLTADGCLNTTEEYKDKEGRVVLKRTYNHNKKTALLEMLSTYYVYDDFGNLKYVLPPGANPDLTSGVPTQATLDAFGYQYKYDSRNRMSEKKIPGKGWEFMVYNKLDQLSMIQDANQRNKAPQEWTYTKYDGLGRVVITGIWKHNGSSADGNANAPSEAHYNWLQGVFNTTTDPLWETRDNSTATGYTNVSLPQDAPAVYNTVSYYDDYTAPGFPALYAILTGGITAPKGLLAASKTAILNADGTVSSNMLWAVSYYDNQGRLLNTYNQHYKGGGVPDVKNYDLVTYNYNFNDQPTVTQRKHYISSSTTQRMTISTRNIYDHMGRKVKTWQAIGNAGQTSNPRTLLAQLDYNDVGQLMTKRLHSTDSATFKQTIDYRYNERGWLSSIGNPDNITATSVFGMKLDYNEGTNKQYNGNIGGMSWQTKVPANPTGLYQQKQSYLYTYDNLSRLIMAAYSDQTSTNANKYNEELTYDVMGNILTLKRRGGSATTFVNDFSYNYTSGGTGNKLWSVTDAVSASQGGSYTYDGNGNVITDTRNQITGITYNMLNLPSTVTRTGGNINYIYDAAGNKLRKTGTETREYIDGIEYSGTTVAFISNEEGRAVPNGAAAYSYDYYLKDHLGNTRAAIKQDGSIVQVQDYYAFGLSMNPGNNTPVQMPENRYKYNGKELQNETGQYDYGARFYDPVIARFTTVDGQAEEMRSHSVYNYGLNNPMRFTDPDGNAPTDIIIRGAGNSSVTVKTELIDIEVNASSLGINFGGNYTLQGDEILSAGLDIVGVFDPTGVADALNGGISAKKGDWFNAAISFAGVIPFAGDLAKAGKIKKDVEIVKDAIKAVDKVEDAAKLEQRAAKLSKVERAGEDFTKAGKDVVKDLNKVENGGKMKCSTCGIDVVPAKKHQKGVTPPSNEAHVDHINKKRNGGSGTPNNGRVRCRGCNIGDQ